jgi:hypothetical protein
MDFVLPIASTVACAYRHEKGIFFAKKKLVQKCQCRNKSCYGTGFKDLNRVFLGESLRDFSRKDL